jgi:hypothetical protein
VDIVNTLLFRQLNTAICHSSESWNPALDAILHACALKRFGAQAWHDNENY